MQKEPNNEHIIFKKSNLSQEIKLLIACCQTVQSEDDIDFIRAFIKTQNTSLHNVITLAYKHGILPLVYKVFLALTVETPIKNTKKGSKEQPFLDEILPQLKMYYTKIAQRNMLMSAELICIIKLLKENNIKALAFKGPTLAQMAYGDITLRQFGDLDILIRKEDQAKMIDILNQKHYIPEIVLKEGTKEIFFSAVNVIGLQHPSNGVFTEVHWELLSKNYAINWEEKIIWKHPTFIHINQVAIPVLPTEQLILYLCAHGSKHLFERLEWICDIDKTIKENPNIDWEYLLKEADNLGIRRMLFLGLTLSQQFFRLILPEMIQKEIAKDTEIPKLISKIIKINFSKSKQREKSYNTFRLLWSMRENLSDQLHFAWRGLFSPKFDDFVFVQLAKNLAFLYPLIRPYRLVTKYFKSS